MASGQGSTDDFRTVLSSTEESCSVRCQGNVDGGVKGLAKHKYLKMSSQLSNQDRNGKGFTGHTGDVLSRSPRNRSRVRGQALQVVREQKSSTRRSADVSWFERCCVQRNYLQQPHRAGILLSGLATRDVV